MKKLNKNGFTLIELLAVITIMGILMLVAIPAVTRIIENSRKDTFINTVQNYVSAAKNMWISDNLTCNTKEPINSQWDISSSIYTGFYFIDIDSSSDSVPQLLESGGKSPWGGRDMKGYILVHAYEDILVGADDVLGTADDVVTRKTDFYPVVSDGVHGVNVDTDGKPLLNPGTGLTKSEDLKRGNLVMSGVGYDEVTVWYDGAWWYNIHVGWQYDATTDTYSYDHPSYQCLEV